MLNGRQGSTSAEIKEPDHTHTLTHAEGSADVLQMPQMIQGRESELLYTSFSQAPPRLSCVTVRLLFHEPTRANCIPARIVLLPSLISLLPQVSWIERDYVTCPLMGGISFIPGQKSRTLTQVTWSAGSGNLHANGVHLCVNPCLNYHVNGKQSETHRWLPDSGSVQSSVSKPFLFCPSTLHFLKKKKNEQKKQSHFLCFS